MSSGVPVQYMPSHEVTRADDGALLAWGADGSLTTRTLGSDVTAYAPDALGRRSWSTSLLVVRCIGWTLRRWTAGLWPRWVTGIE